MNKIDLANKKAIVTGAARGIGYAIAERLLQSGASVSIWDVDVDAMAEAALELSKGKLTTDPKNHSGQGIFFSSRAFDSFGLYSGGLTVSVEGGSTWLLDEKLYPIGAPEEPARPCK